MFILELKIFKYLNKFSYLCSNEYEWMYDASNVLREKIEKDEISENFS